MTPREWQLKYGFSDPDMEVIKWAVKHYNGKVIKVVDKRIEYDNIISKEIKT